MTQLLTRNDKYTADYLAFARSVAGDSPAWVRTLREEAWRRFSDVGFPTATRGNEAWKYTNVAPIDRAAFRLPPASTPVRESQLRNVVPWRRRAWANLVFVNGRFAAHLSTPGGKLQGATVTGLARAIAAEDAVVREHLGVHAPLGHDGFSALNTAFLADGAYIHLPTDVSLKMPVHVLHITTATDEPVVTHPRTLVVAGRNSKLTLVETYVTLGAGSGVKAGHFTNAVTEMVLEDGANVEHYRLQLENEGAFHIGRTHVYQGADSSLNSTFFALGSALARNEVHALLDAPGASCVMHGLYRMSGDQHIDNDINIDHAKPNANSRVYYKGILDGKSKAVFSGRVLVRKDAQKTQALQHDKNLILSRGAEIFTKPSLEIFADDVKCFHGAAAGEMSEDALFYLQARGIRKDEAVQMLIHAFAMEIIDTVRNPWLQQYVDTLFSKGMPGRPVTTGAASGFMRES